MKRKIALLLTAAMLLSSFTACKNNEDSNSATNGNDVTTADGNSSTNSGNAITEVDFSEHETFTIWQQADSNDYYSEYEDNPIINYIANKFNVTFDFEHPAVGSENDSMSLMIGTGEYTDMMDLNYLSASISDLYDDGVVINIADYLEYMPNFKNLLDTNEGFARYMYDDAGRILRLKTLYTEAELVWGGLVYRRDILDTMTGGNIVFPSGNSEPTTIEDWDYMLPIYKQYFEAAGMELYAPFILPYTSLFAFSELVNGFGVGGSYYVEDNQVKYGPIEEGFYNYLSKMKEWYSLGYIYKDFASSTNDPVYFPNTALTYGGASGIWYGLQSSLGDAMSMPEYGLFFDVQPMKNPIDTAHGITEAAPFAKTTVDNIQAAGYAVTSACKNIPKLLSIIDFMYSEEAGMYYYGVTADMGASENPIMAKAGLEEGNYWYDESGKFTWNPLFTVAGGTVDVDPFINARFIFMREQKYFNESAKDLLKLADNVWAAYPDAKQKNLPSAIDRAGDTAKFETNATAINDYQFTAFANFILGTTELNEETWNTYVEQLKSLGVTENIAIQQAAYERYLAR